MSRPDPNETVYEEAAAWVVRLADDAVSPFERQAFEAWRAEGPDHAQAFADAQSSWNMLGEYAASPELLTRRRDALDRVRNSGRRRWAGPAWTDRRAVAAGLVALFAAPAAAFWWIRARKAVVAQYQTGRGEQQTFVLSDGSLMSLDARTTVKVAYARDLRSIELVAGRANFEVAKDVARPMKVHAAGRTVTALGTVFTVEHAPRAVVVTLVEGRVAVTGGGAPIVMAPRQQLTMADGLPPSLREIDPEEALAWREGKLVFDDVPLASAAARMNNYSAETLVIGDDAQQLRVSGVFRAGDTDAFVDAMENYFPVATERSGGVINVRLRR